MRCRTPLLLPGQGAFLQQCEHHSVDDLQLLGPLHIKLMQPKLFDCVINMTIVRSNMIFHSTEENKSTPFPPELREGLMDFKDTLKKCKRGSGGGPNQSGDVKADAASTSLQRGTSVHRQRRAAPFITTRSSGGGLNWAVRSPWQRGPPRCGVGEGECGRGFHAEVVEKWRESLFTCTVLGDPRGRLPNTQ